MKFFLLLIFLFSSLACAYFIVTFLRQVNKAIAKQEPPPVGLLVMVLVFIIIMLAEASAALGVMIHLS